MLSATVGVVLDEKEIHGSLLPKLAYNSLRFDNEKLRGVSGQPFSCREATPTSFVFPPAAQLQVIPR